MACMRMTFCEKGAIQISGRWVAFTVKLHVGSRMGIEESLHTGRNDKEKQQISKASEIATVFTMARRCSSPFAIAIRTMYDTCERRISLLDPLFH
jgi:hypothetical protein